MAGPTDTAFAKAPDIAVRPSAPQPERLPRVSIHVLIVVLMISLIVPAVLFLGHSIERIEAARQEEVRQRGERLADDVADRLEAEFRTMRTLLAVFASSGWLEEEQYRLLHQRAQRALAGSSRHLLVLDEDLQQILNTRVAFGAPLGETGDAATAAEVLETGAQTVSNLFRGTVADAPVFNALRHAVLPDGSRRVMILTENAADLHRLFGFSDGTGGWNFAVIDGAGQPVLQETAAAPDSEALPGGCLLRRDLGLRTWDGAADELFIFRDALAGTSWSVCVWGDTERLLARSTPLWNSFRIAAVAWFVAAMAAAIALSSVVSRAIAATGRIGSALEQGRPVRYTPSFIAEVDATRRALAGAAAERLRKDQERQLLLRETTHRAKNQMALAVSLIGLSAQSAKDVAGLRDDVTARLTAIGRSVDAASAGGAAGATPLEPLVRAQIHPFFDERSDRVLIEGAEVRLSQQAAQSFGLVLHELATNSAKYGGWSGPDGAVDIRWRVAGDALAFDWSERGGQGGDPGSTGFGTRLIDGLIGGLRGTVRRDFTAEGFSCRIEVPLASVTAGAGEDRPAPPDEGEGRQG